MMFSRRTVLSGLGMAAAGRAMAAATLPPAVGTGLPVTLNGVKTTVDAALLGRPTPLVTQRPPTATDDVTAGFASGNLWLIPGRLWQCQRATAGQAAWTTVAPAGLVGDAVAGAGVLYGTSLLRRAYSSAAAPGKALTVTRTTDNTNVDLFFLPDGSLDTATGDAFTAGLTPQQCVVTTLYDQSGNGNHATATTAYGPLWDPACAVNGVRAIRFASVPNQTGTVAAVTRYMVMPGGFAWTPGSSSWLMVGQQLNTQAARGLFETTTNIGVLTNYLQATPARLTLEGGSGAINLPMEVGPTVFAMAWGNAAITAFVNNAAVTNGNGGSGTATTGGRIGSTQFPADMDLVALAGVPATLSGAQLQAWRVAAHAQFAIAPQPTDIALYDGDSTGSGAGSPNDNSPWKNALPLLARPVRAFNTALFGQTLASVLTRLPYTLGAITNPAARTVVYVVLAGANDIRGGASAASVFATLQALCTQAQAYGGNVKVMVCTEWLQGDIAGTPAQLAAFVAYNTLIRQGWNVPAAQGGLGAAALYDLWADPTIGPASSATTSALTNPLYATTDLQHPTDLSMALMGAGLAAAVNPLLAS